MLGWLDKGLREVVVRGEGIDCKSRLQELVQSEYHSSPAYRTVQATGPDHDRRFTVEVMIEGRVLGRGSGKSRKLAETEAARQVLEWLGSGFTR